LVSRPKPLYKNHAKTTKIIKGKNLSIIFSPPLKHRQLQVAYNSHRVLPILLFKDLKSTFDVTDNKNKFTVEYTGILPDLFREGQGIVTTGSLVGNLFVATEVPMTLYFLSDFVG
jgi:hypothetical protein